MGLEYLGRAGVQSTATITTMAPRTRGKEEPHQEVDDGRPTVADLQGENPFAQLAKKHWLKTSKKPAKVKVKPDVLKTEIWDVLEQENFAFKPLLVLENLQILEKYGPLF
jgi:intron-binding protein aquarius